MYKVPTKSTDCIYCYKYDQLTNKITHGNQFCSDHPNGNDYTGFEVYEPSEWVKEVVGKLYKGSFSEGTYQCTGYDPKAGFWMKNVDDPTDIRNVSERAIDRTYHRIRVY